MKYNEHGPVGMYFEEFEVGATMRTRARTVTEADVVNFAGVTGDYNPLHTSKTYAESTAFERRISHGMLAVSYAVGQAYALGILEQTILAFREMSVKFSHPVYIGDTIHVDMEVTETKAMKRLGGGIVVIDFKIVNQDGKAVQKGQWSFLMASTPTE
ncbi:MAG: MaoC/PaaZ C-terminal domain-containing protein [Chloroflexota bacterium]